MKKAVLLLTFFVAGIFFSCSKPACENCDNYPRIGGLNKPPIAIAGPDQVITLPNDSVLLDGSASTDPEGRIISWLWRPIGDFSMSWFEPVTSSKVVIDSLVSGVFLFELKVTDEGAITSFDTIQVIVNGTDCIISGRPSIDPQLIEIGTLSEAREPVAVAAGNKVVFAGGYAFVCGPDFGKESSAVDIYDVVTNSWTTSQLSLARAGMAAVAAGNKIFFAGGLGPQDTVDNVDIYDAVTNTWTAAHLSRPGINLSTGSLGNQVFFTGGFSNHVDIYNLSTDTWSTATLSVARANIGVIANGNKIYFAGGISSRYTPYKTIDIYDNTTNSWTTSSLRELEGEISGISEGDKIFWTKGNRVEIMNTTNGSTNFECLTANYSKEAVKRNDDIIFISGILSYGDFLNIYNTRNGKWSHGRLRKNFPGAGIISSNNKIYVGGGWEGNTECQSNKVYMINW